MKAGAGFTLLETLVALLVLSFVMLGLAQGLRMGLAAWDHQAEVISRDGALDAADRTLRMLIAAMAPAGDPRIVAVQGTHDRLAFTADLPEGAPIAPLRQADIVLAVDASHRLLMRWTPHLHARLLAPLPVREAILLPGVAGLTLAYFRPAASGQPAGWVGDWQGAIPPSLVRIHIDFVDPRLRWPDVIVAPVRRPDYE